MIPERHPNIKRLGKALPLSAGSLTTCPPPKRMLESFLSKEAITEELRSQPETVLRKQQPKAFSAQVSDFEIVPEIRFR